MSEQASVSPPSGALTIVHLYGVFKIAIIFRRRRRVGETHVELPVNIPVKYEDVIRLATAFCILSTSSWKLGVMFFARPGLESCPVTSNVYCGDGVASPRTGLNDHRHRPEYVDTESGGQMILEDHGDPTRTRPTATASSFQLANNA
jgi:hypothetical protein